MTVASLAEAPPRFLSLAQLTARWGVSRSTIYRWIDEGRLDSARDTLGGRTYVALADVEALRRAPPP